MTVPQMTSSSSVTAYFYHADRKNLSYIVQLHLDSANGKGMQDFSKLMWYKNKEKKKKKKDYRAKKKKGEIITRNSLTIRVNTRPESLSKHQTNWTSSNKESK